MIQFMEEPKSAIDDTWIKVGAIAQNFIYERTKCQAEFVSWTEVCQHLI